MDKHRTYILVIRCRRIIFRVVDNILVNIFHLGISVHLLADTRQAFPHILPDLVFSQFRLLPGHIVSAGEGNLFNLVSHGIPCEGIAVHIKDFRMVVEHTLKGFFYDIRFRTGQSYPFPKVLENLQYLRIGDLFLFAEPFVMETPHLLLPGHGGFRRINSRKPRHLVLMGLLPFPHSQKPWLALALAGSLQRTAFCPLPPTAAGSK